MTKPKKIVRKDGSVAYRIVFDAGRDPETGKRKQLTRTFDRRKDADAELARVRHQRTAGIYVAPSRLTVAKMLDEFLASACFEREEATKSNYVHALRLPRARLGDRLVQSVTRQDIEELRDFMLSAGRKRGGAPGSGLGARSVRLAISRLSAAFEQAAEDGKVTRNPCRGVRLPKLARPEKVTWSAGQARAFLAVASADRLHAAWRMCLYGARREEVCGAQWAAIDLDAGTWTIARVRVVVDGKVIAKAAPKSERSARTLPLPADLIAVLRELRKRQAAEKLAAGSAYTPTGYVVVDEVGEPVSPEWFSDEFERIAQRAGVPRMTPHGARHSANSLMEKAGVPDSIRAAWCGHTVQVNRATYTHANPEDLAAARDTLSQLYGPAGEVM